MIAELVPYIGPISVAFATLAFIVYWCLEPKAQFQTLLSRALAVGRVPYALVMIYAALDPTIWAKVTGLSIPTLIGGLYLLHMSVTAATAKDN